MTKDRVAGVVIGTLVIVIVMLGQINFLPAGRVDHCQMSKLQSDFGNNLIFFSCMVNFQKLPAKECYIINYHSLYYIGHFICNLCTILKTMTENVALGRDGISIACYSMPLHGSENIHSIIFMFMFGHLKPKVLKCSDGSLLMGGWVQCLEQKVRFFFSGGWGWILPTARRMREREWGK